jgi:hypothetical protein
MMPFIGFYANRILDGAVAKRFNEPMPVLKATPRRLLALDLRHLGAVCIRQRTRRR